MKHEKPDFILKRNKIVFMKKIFVFLVLFVVD